MAKDEEKDKNEESESDNKEAKQGASKKRLVILVVLALLIAGISVGGTLAALHFLGAKPDVPAEHIEAEDLPPPPPKDAIYYPIKPEIIVTYEARGRQRYLMAEVTLMTRDDDVVSAIELHMPKVRNALNMIMGSQIYEDVQTAEGKELMRQQCLQEMQNIMEQEIGKPGVEQVLFTNLVLQ